LPNLYPEVIVRNIKVRGCFGCGDPAGLQSQPELKLRTVDHAAERGLLVLELATFLTGLASGPRRVVNYACARVALVLVLAAFPSGSEVLYLAVVDADAQD
jgi:hypothetical protein